jgi:hypothetical protein
MTRRIEFICGLWSGGLSILAALLSLYAMRAINTAGPDGATPLSERTMYFMGLVILGGLGTACGAYLHAGRLITAALGLLWLAAALLVALTMAAIFSVGVFLLPGAILAVVAAIAGARAQAGQLARLPE